MIPIHLAGTRFSGIQRTIFQRLNRVDVKPMEFEWKIYPGFTSGLSSLRFRNDLAKYSDPADFKGRIIFMQKEMKNCAKIIQKEVKDTLDTFLAVIGLSLDPDLRSSGTELRIANQVDLGLERRRKCC